MIELFLQELLEDWRQGRLTQEELLDGWTASGFTLPQMIDVLLHMLQSHAQRIHALKPMGSFVDESVSCKNVM